MRQFLLGVVLGCCFLLLEAVSAPATWVPDPNNPPDPRTKAWFEDQYIMPAARKRLDRDYKVGWVKCCSHADRVRVHFVVKGGQYFGIKKDGTAILLPRDTIHPPDSSMPAQLAVEGVVMVVPKGLFGAPQDIVTCTWLPQSGI